MLDPQEVRKELEKRGEKVWANQYQTLEQRLAVVLEKQAQSSISKETIYQRKAERDVRETFTDFDKVIKELNEDSARMHTGMGGFITVVENTFKMADRRLQGLWNIYDQELRDLSERFVKSKYDLSKFDIEERAKLKSVYDTLLQKRVGEISSQSQSISQRVQQGTTGRNAAEGLALGAIGASASRDGLTKMLYGESGNIEKVIAHLGLHKIPIVGTLTKLPVVRSVLGRLAGTIGKEGIIGAGLRLAPFLSTLEGLKHGYQEYIGAARSGKVTGEGVSAGLAAQFQGIGYRLANPLGIVTFGMAQEIINGVRQQGFKDQIANAMANSIGDTINKLGTNLDQTLETTVTYVRGTTQANSGPGIINALHDFQDSISNLAGTAKASGVSINEAMSSIQNAVNFAAQQGGPSGVAAAPIVAQAFMNALQIKPLPFQGKGFAGQLIQSAAPMLTALGGGNPMLAGTDIGLQAEEMGAMRLAGLLNNQFQASLPSLREQYPGRSLSELQNLFVDLNAPLFNSMGLGALTPSQRVSFMKGAKNIRRQQNKTIGQGALSAGLAQMKIASARAQKNHPYFGPPPGVTWTPGQYQIAQNKALGWVAQQRHLGFAQGLENYLMAQGNMSKQEAERIAAPFRHASVAEFNRLIEGTQKRVNGTAIGPGQKPIEVRVMIELNKDAKKIISAKGIIGSQNYYNYQTGNSGAVPGQMMPGIYFP